MESLVKKLSRGLIPYILLAVLLILCYAVAAPHVKLTGSSGGSRMSQHGNSPGNDQAAQFPPSGGNAAPGGGPSGVPAGGTGGAPGGNSTGVQGTGSYSPGSGSASAGHGRGSSRTPGAGRNFSGNFGGGHPAATPYEGDALVRGVMAGAILFIVVVLGVSVFKHRLHAKTVLAAIIAAGIILRVGYMLYTPFYIRGHDIGTLSGNGHYAYMYTIFKTGALPATNSGQFYHPPLNYVLCALVAKVYSLMTHSSNIDTIFESVRLVPAFASCALLFVSFRLLAETGLNSTAKLVALALISFHPAFIILSASINNDMLMIFFFVISLLYTVRWYKRPSFKNAALAALSGGLSMMSKFSGGLIAVFAAAVFIAVFMHRFRQKGLARIAGQAGIYLAIFLPLGLWYSVRNLILFHQPIGYVLKVGGGSMEIGGRSLAARIFSIPFGKIFAPIYCNPFGDYNIPLYILKCSLFGEFSYTSGHSVAAIALIVLNVMLIAVSLAAMVCILIRGKKINPILRFGFPFLWFMTISSYIYFNIKYPVTCTMDFRYIVPTVIIGAVLTGTAVSLMKSHNSALYRVSFVSCSILTSLFCVVSAVFFML